MERDSRFTVKITPNGINKQPNPGLSRMRFTGLSSLCSLQPRFGIALCTPQSTEVRVLHEADLPDNTRTCHWMDEFDIPLKHPLAVFGRLLEYHYIAQSVVPRPATLTANAEPLV